ncbi:MAG: NupC/NupG family nucleoside CNT transporter [Zetaproteobacteria bacterium]|nr:NupC/NupG family nucleoside CNT transporter [Pseudobdellovibrionaceae bacterium]
MQDKLISVIGLFTMLFIAWLFSNNKKKIDFRSIAGGLFLQFILAYFVLHTNFGKAFFAMATTAITSVVETTDIGSKFVFGENFKDHFYVFKVLPTIIFMSSLSYIFFYFGIIQRVVKVLAWIMLKTMNISGCESLVTAANIFLGQTEAPLFIKPYLKTMTRSEVMTMMTSGMATVAGGVLAAYIGLGVPAGHLLAASIMSAPAAIMLSKIIYPETQESPTKGSVKVHFEVKEVNIFESACSGASAGLNLALNVGAMLITFIALIALINKSLTIFHFLFGWDLTLESMLGTLFQPIAFLIGIPWSESALVGELLGKKMVINEFIAYVDLLNYRDTGLLSERSVNICTYALCGFANFSSIAIQIGGIGALEPSRRADFAKCGFKALIGGTLAGFMTACMAGILIS